MQEGNALAVRVSVTEPERISEVEGLYTGLTMAELEKLPVPELVQVTEAKLEADAPESRYVVFSQMDASGPALTAGVLFMVSTNESVIVPGHGAIASTLSVRITLPEAMSAALGV